MLLFEKFENIEVITSSKEAEALCGGTRIPDVFLFSINSEI